MATLMTTGARPVPADTTSSVIHDHLMDNPVASIADAVARHRQCRAAYAGGLPAEQQTYRRLRQRTRSGIRAAYLSRVGRRIDLIALLRQRDQEKRPIWTVADPAHEVGSSNGLIAEDGDVRVYNGGWLETRRKIQGGISVVPKGMPALPPRVRELATDPKIRKRAQWVGVLYQPEEWDAVNPDPALIVEWKDRPGEYYALAIWGGDRAAIEEFVE